MNMNKQTTFFLFVLFCGHVVSTSLISASYTLPRINETAIKRQIPSIKRMLRRNTLVRYGTLTAAAAAGTAATFYLFRNWFTGPQQAPQPQPAPTEAGQDGLAERIQQLENDLFYVRQARTAGQLPFPLNWAKTIGIFGLQTAGWIVLYNSIQKIQRHCNNVIFKPRDLKWFITMQTHIGLFIEFEDANGVTHEQFYEGRLLTELRQMAKLMNTVQGATDTRENEQVAQLFCSVCSSLVKEVTYVIAFMQHIINTKLLVSPQEIRLSSFRSDAECFAHYLMNYTNTFCQTVEQMVASKLAHPNQPIDACNAVQKFVSDLKGMIDGFTRILEEAEITL